MLRPTLASAGRHASGPREGRCTHSDLLPAQLPASCLAPGPAAAAGVERVSGKLCLCTRKPRDGAQRGPLLETPAVHQPGQTLEPEAEGGSDHWTAQCSGSRSWGNVTVFPSAAVTVVCSSAPSLLHRAGGLASPGAPRKGTVGHLGVGQRGRISSI